MASDSCRSCRWSQQNQRLHSNLAPFATILFLLLMSVHQSSSLHLKGTWHTHEFFKFLAKFGFQKTNLLDKLNTQGYIYGNITTTDNVTTDLTFVVVDSEYFLEYYGNRTVTPQSAACSSMFNKIDKIAWDYPCNPDGHEDFLRKIPCPSGQYCIDEDEPSRIVPGYQFTYAVQDTTSPRFWYVSMVSCYHNGTQQSQCTWMHNANQDIKLHYDIWLVNGNPFTKHINPFEHQFSFELHDVFEIYAVFLVLYTVLVPIQMYALSQQKHMVPFLLTTAMSMEYVGAVFNFIHILKFALDGTGLDVLKVVGNFIDQVAQCLFMLLLLLIVKGWSISRADLVTRAKLVLLTIWGTYTIANLSLFIWNLMAVDIISGVDEWQTWPGYLILAFRILIMVWFLLELRETFASERSREKTQFYLHFGAGFLVWFVYLPIVAIVGTQVSALWRYKTMLSVTYSADLLSYAVMTHLLWPGRRSLYFNLKVEARCRVEELEITGMRFQEDLDSGSEESIDIHETATLLRVAKHNGHHDNNTGQSILTNEEREDYLWETMRAANHSKDVTSDLANEDHHNQIANGNAVYKECDEDSS